MIHLFTRSRISRRRAFSILTASVLLAASFSACADEITVDDAPEAEDAVITYPEETAADTGGALIEDLGSDAGLEDGISMSDLEEEEPYTELVPEIDLIDADPERIEKQLESLLETPDPTGSDEELTVAAYIGKEMSALGYTVQQQPFHEGFVNINGIDAPGVNIIAERGADSEENRTRDIFLVVTHYDSRTLPEGSEPPADDPYVNDKTGAAVLLETARILAEVDTDTDLCFLFLSGQEDGGYGAKAFIDSLSDENRSRIRGVLVADRFGYDTGMPNVLKTLTGEENSIVTLVRDCGIWQEARLIMEGVRSLPKETAEPGSMDGIPADSESAVEGMILLEDADSLSGTAAETQAGETEAAETKTNEESRIPVVWSCLTDPYVVSEDADPVQNPDLNSIQSIFANAGFPAAQITQYDPGTDLELYQQTIALGLADTTADSLTLAVRQVQNDGIYELIDTFNDVEIIGLEDSGLSAQAEETAADASMDTAAAPQEISEASEADGILETETESELPLPKADPILLAQNADVLAESLAYIMGTN